METNFNNLIDILNYFSNEETCWKHLEQLRWNGKVVCPFCKSEKHYHFKKSHTYKCTKCKKKFNAKIGTIFENSKIPLSKWFLAIYIVTSHKKGISSCQLAKDIGITQKSAWFVLHRIREMLKEKAPRMLNSVVELDEVYIGGQNRYKHKSKRKNIDGYVGKTMVFAMLDRKSGVRTTIVKGVSGNELKPIIRKHVSKYSMLVSDGFGAYYGLKDEYTDHIVINHEQDEWVKGDFHTNTIEGFFSQLKRSIYGIYHNVSPKHLQAYCNESAFRYNTRKAKEANRFDFSFITCERRLKYNDLINR